MSNGERGGDLPQILYVGGLGRSGSTLLSCMLQEIDGCFAVGEIRLVWRCGVRENRRCGCGLPFSDCPVWQEIGQRAYGGWDTEAVKEVSNLSTLIDRQRYVPWLVAPKLASASFRRRLARYIELVTPLYLAISDVTGARIVVDASKARSYMAALRHLPDVDLRAVHLIRDARGTAYSWTKHVDMPDVVEGSRLMPRYTPARIALRWVSGNLAMEILERMGVPTVRLRYESLVAHPRPELTRIVELIGETVGPETLSFVDGDAATFGVNHTVQGNPIRMGSGTTRLRIDDAWRRELPPRDRTLVTFVTWLLMRRYGYRPTATARP